MREPSGYYRHPTVSGDTVVFVCEDDLWAVDVAGGRARRLTANPGRITFPSFSPDGKSLLFTGPAADEFRRAPCTRAGHHSYVGGLIEHTVAVATLVTETCTLHPRLNSDLLMAAALIHDIGKTGEFTYGAEIGLTERGRTLGHLQIGAELITEAAAGLETG